MDKKDRSEESWYLYGNKYDLTDFIDQHPGGRDILELVKSSNDITPLFESYHAFADIESIKKTLEKYKVEENVKTQLYTFDENGFYYTVKERVRRYFGNNRVLTNKIKINNLWKFKAFGLIILFIICYYFAFFSFLNIVNRSIFSFLSGILIIMIGFSIMHDASHYALFNKKNININILLSKIWNSFILWDYKLWFVHHGANHHAYTGNPNLDPDLKFTKPLLIKSPLSNSRGYIKLANDYLLAIISVIYFFIFPGFVIGQGILYWGFWRKNGKLWGIQKSFSIMDISLIQIIGFIFVIYSHLYNFSLLVSSLYFIAANIAYGFCILPDHDTYQTVINHKNINTNDWGEAQVIHSANFENNVRNDIFCHLFGGINYQIEHHLFPSVCHVHYPKISKIVKTTCKEFDINYVEHESIYSAMKDVVKSLIILNEKQKEN
jgi:linoleoyl-CoA desaturase